MADLSITAASVVAGSDDIARANAGEAITAGQPVYKDPTTLKFMKADNDSATAHSHEVVGVALNGAALNQPLAVQKSGPITIGATLTPGAAYCLSSTAGGICPVADVTTGSEVVQLGLAASATVLDLAIQKTGVTL
jgi:hypothetical protein